VGFFGQASFGLLRNIDTHGPLLLSGYAKRYRFEGRGREVNIVSDRKRKAAGLAATTVEADIPVLCSKVRWDPTVHLLAPLRGDARTAPRNRHCGGRRRGLREPYTPGAGVTKSKLPCRHCGALGKRFLSDRDHRLRVV
jgi:hypothetical protein